jgi:hypothetical protein
MAVLPKAIHMTNATPNIIPMTSITKTEKSMLNIEAPKTTYSQSNADKKSNSGSITISSFKLFSRAIAIKSNMVLAQKQI